MFFNYLRNDLETMGKPKPDMLGGGANSNKTADELFQMALPQDIHLDYYPMEEKWTLDAAKSYDSKPQGNPIDMAKKALSIIEK